MHTQTLLAIPLSLLLSCAKGPEPARTDADAASTREAQVEAHDIELVKDSARLYWDAVRWGDGSKAASFLEDPDERLLYEAWLEDQKESIRYEDVMVLQVKMVPEPEEPQADRLKEATAHIRVKRYQLPAQVLESETLQQEWYKSATGWWIDWELPAD